MCLFPGPVWHLLPVELCCQGQQAAFKAAGKVQQVHTTARSSAVGIDNEAAGVAAPMEGRL